MYTFSAPQNFVDNTDLDMESEWNTQYVTSSLELSSPLFQAESPESSTSPSSELLYECSFCMSSHSPDSPCGSELNYTLQLPVNASYAYEKPVYVEDKALQNAFLQSNYRKWLVSVTPR